MIVSFFLALIFILPAAAMIWFIVSLVRYMRVKGDNTQERENCKRMLVASAVSAGVSVAALTLLIVMFTLSIRHM